MARAPWARCRPTPPMARSGRRRRRRAGPPHERRGAGSRRLPPAAGAPSSRPGALPGHARRRRRLHRRAAGSPAPPPPAGLRGASAGDGGFALATDSVALTASNLALMFARSAAFSATFGSTAAAASAPSIARTSRLFSCCTSVLSGRTPHTTCSFFCPSFFVPRVRGLRARRGAGLAAMLGPCVRLPGEGCEPVVHEAWQGGAIKLRLSSPPRAAPQRRAPKTT